MHKHVKINSWLEIMMVTDKKFTWVLKVSWSYSWIIVSFLSLLFSWGKRDVKKKKKKIQEVQWIKPKESLSYQWIQSEIWRSGEMKFTLA